mgnify:CR=1 FL=1
MRTMLFVLSSCAAMALAGCGKSAAGPRCVAKEVGNGLVSLGEPGYDYPCSAGAATRAMAIYVGEHPELDVEVIAINRRGAITTLRTSPKAETKTPAAK